MTRFLASWVVHAAVGWAVAPRTRTRRGGVLDDGEHVQARSGQRSGLEEVGGEDRVCLAAQEGGPGLMVALGYGLDSVALQDFPHGGGGDRDAESGQLAVDASVAPTGVLPRQAHDEGSDTANRRRPAGPFRAGRVGVVTAEQVAVPTQNGIGRDDQVQLPQLRPW
jgi:hypothetical protein